MKRKIKPKTLLEIWQVLDREKIKSLKFSTVNKAMWYKEILEAYGLEVTRVASKNLIVNGTCTKIPINTGGQDLKIRLWEFEKIRVVDACSFKILDGFDQWNKLKSLNHRQYRNVVIIYKK